MSLLKDWREFAYSHDDRTQEGQRFWIDYFQQEKAVYEQILSNPDEPVSGTVAELAEKFNMELTYFVGYLDGINDSLKTPNPIEEMDENSCTVSFTIRIMTCLNFHLRRCHQSA